MQSRIVYNGVTISDVLTDTISHDVVKDSTGVDQAGVRVVGSFTGIVHVSAQNQIGKQVTPTLGTGLNDLLSSLTKDRRGFQMYVGSSLLYDVRPGAAEPNAPNGTVTADLDKMDINNGPTPSVTINKLVSGYSATIQFKIEFTTPNCGGGYAKNNTGLVNFRFWIGEDIDCRTWLTSRTYMGRLRVAHKNVNPHALARQIAIPPQQRGFKREVISLSESEDGLHLDFTVRDQEIIAAAPWSPGGKFGAVDWNGVYQVSTSDGVRSIADITVQLTGPKGTSKEDLFFLAQKVVSQKIHMLDFLDLKSAFAGQAYLRHFGLKEVLQENVIEVSARLEHTGADAYAIGLFTPGKGATIGKPLGGLQIGFDDQVAYMPGQSATLTGMFLSVLQTPCSPAKMPQVTDKPPKDYEQKYKEGSKEISPEKYIPKYTVDKPSDSHLSAMYLHYALDSELIANSGRLALPTGAASSSTASSFAVVQLYRPTSIREIRLEATRVGLPPELPTPNVSFADSNQIQHVQIGDAAITSSAPQVSADARKLLYGSHMQIRYAMSRPPRTGETVAVGALPYRVSGANDPSRRLPAEIFVDPKKLLT